MSFFMAVLLLPAAYGLLALFKGESPSGKAKEAKAVLVVPISKADSKTKKKLRELEKIKFLRVVAAYDGIDPLPSSLESEAFPKLGKNEVISRVLSKAKEEVFIVSDSDALISEESLKKIISVLDGDIGGACGRLVFKKKSPSSKYWSYQERLKKVENCLLGSVTSSTGALLAIKREVFEPIPPEVTDDMFLMLKTVEKGKRFVFVEDATAESSVPSSSRKTVARRRRIACRSLSNFKYFRPLSNLPYFFCLVIQKVLRRYAFFSLCAVLAVSPWRIVLVYMPFLLFSDHFRYFAAENLGALLGLIDFLRGKKYVSWS